MATNPSSLMIYSPQRSASMGRRAQLPEQYGFRPKAVGASPIVGASPMAATALPKVPKTVDEMIYAPATDVGQYGGVGEGEGLGVGPGGSTGKGGADLGTVASTFGPSIFGGPLGFGLNMGSYALSGGKHGTAGLVGKGLGLLGGYIGEGLSSLGLMSQSGEFSEGGEYSTMGGTHSGSAPGQEGQFAEGGEYSTGRGSHSGPGPGDDGGLGLAGIGVGGADSGAGGTAGGVAGDGGGFGYGVGGGGIW